MIDSEIIIPKLKVVQLHDYCQESQPIIKENQGRVNNRLFLTEEFVL